MTVRWLIASGLPAALADIPVHCLSSEIAGSWNIFMGPASQSTHACGHARPDKPSASAQPTKLYGISTGGVEAPISTDDPEVTQVHINIEDETTNRATMTKMIANGQTKSTNIVGSYTMVYDEGFEITLKHPDDTILKMFAFSKFDQRSTTKKPISYCNEVFTGWFQMVKKSKEIRYGCWTGSKEASPNRVHSQRRQGRTMLSLAQGHQAGHFHINNMTIRDSSDFDMFTAGQHLNDFHYDNFEHVDIDSPITEEEFHVVAQHLNDILPEGSWTATAHSKFFNMSLRELNRIAGSKSQVNLDQTDSISLRKGHHEIPTLPRDLVQQGYEVKQVYTGYPGDQGGCGSCFVYSMMKVVTARARMDKIIKNDESFSVAWPLACSEYNQGCEGGYPYLVMKWLDEHGVLLDSELPYKPHFKKQCSAVQQHLAATLPTMNRVQLKSRTPEVVPNRGQRHYVVSSYGYVGGFYGKTNHDLMMQELYHGGPMAIAYQVPDVFMWYQGGVFGASGTSVSMPSAVSILHEMRKFKLRSMGMDRMSLKQVARKVKPRLYKKLCAATPSPSASSKW